MTAFIGRGQPSGIVNFVCESAILNGFTMAAKLEVGRKEKLIICLAVLCIV